MAGNRGRWTLQAAAMSGDPGFRGLPVHHLGQVTDLFAPQGHSLPFSTRQCTATCFSLDHTLAQQSHNVKVLQNWPPCSPDLNPVENCWAHLAAGLQGKALKNNEQLWEGIKSAWHNVPRSFITALYSSMPDRIAAVVDAHGGHTKY